MTAWTEKEENYLLDNYGKLADKRIAEKLGRTIGTIRGKHYRMTGTSAKTEKRKGRKHYCLLCGKEGNEVVSFVDKCARTVYYCTDCMVEFKGKTIIRPMLEG